MIDLIKEPTDNIEWNDVDNLVELESDWEPTVSIVNNNDDRPLSLDDMSYITLWI